MKQQVMIRPVKLTDAEVLYQLVDRNRANLRIWLPWVDAMHSAQDELNFLDYSVQKMANGGLWMMTILVDQQVVGMIDIHNLEPTEQSGEIGYWLTANQRGQGVMAQALQQLEQLASQQLGLSQLRIITAMTNETSQAVAKRAGYQQIADFEGQVTVANVVQTGLLYVKKLAKITTK